MRRNLRIRWIIYLIRIGWFWLLDLHRFNDGYFLPWVNQSWPCRIRNLFSRVKTSRFKNLWVLGHKLRHRLRYGWLCLWGFIGLDTYRGKLSKNKSLISVSSMNDVSLLRIRMIEVIFMSNKVYIGRYIKLLNEWMIIFVTFFSRWIPHKNVLNCS